LQKNLPKPDFAHDGKAATLLEKISILDHVGVLLGAQWFDFFELCFVSFFLVPLTKFVSSNLVAGV
jgi:hypothetical protein